jgi:hypothetical protein
MARKIKAGVEKPAQKHSGEDEPQPVISSRVLQRQVDVLKGEKEMWGQEKAELNSEMAELQQKKGELMRLQKDLENSKEATKRAQMDLKNSKEATKRWKEKAELLKTERKGFKCAQVDRTAGQSASSPDATAELLRIQLATVQFRLEQSREAAVDNAKLRTQNASQAETVRQLNLQIQRFEEDRTQRGQSTQVNDFLTKEVETLRAELMQKNQLLTIADLKLQLQQQPTPPAGDGFAAFSKEKTQLEDAIKLATLKKQYREL